jgi:uncharacterized protein (DUF111 family)
VCSIRILGEADVESELTRLCFEETTTIGIRKQLVKRSILQREEMTVADEGASYRVKVVKRPSATSVKAEMDDISTVTGGMTSRKKLRKRVETVAEEYLANEHPGKNHPE